MLASILCMHIITGLDCTGLKIQHCTNIPDLLMLLHVMLCKCIKHVVYSFINLNSWGYSTQALEEPINSTANFSMHTMPTHLYLILYAQYYLIQKHRWCKKVQPSKVESYLEMNTQTNWQQQDLILVYSQELSILNI